VQKENKEKVLHIELLAAIAGLSTSPGFRVGIARFASASLGFTSSSSRPSLACPHRPASALSASPASTSPSFTVVVGIKKGNVWWHCFNTTGADANSSCVLKLLLPPF
jgi:hypothetical protein